jgi:hypothetical protein
VSRITAAVPCRLAVNAVRGATDGYARFPLDNTDVDLAGMAHVDTLDDRETVILANQAELSQIAAECCRTGACGGGSSTTPLPANGFRE